MASDESDTCRICRSEGSLDEPLFHPCKCSGTIQFVHQSCLVEWLSHSQKKYCELCKTQYKFTKLYHPDMPQKLPLTMFFRLIFWHFVRIVVIWLRGILVATVWLIALPWCMRFLWRLLFWLGDGGWAREVYLVSAHLQRIADAEENLLNFTSPSFPLNASNYNETLSAILSSFKENINTTRQNSALLSTARKLLNYYQSNRSESFDGSPNNTVSSAVSLILSQSRSSILSDVKLLHKLFSSSVTIRFAVDVLEGQLITVLVVVAFILVFLIREWVVQQQPIIDMAPNAAEIALGRVGGALLLPENDVAPLPVPEPPPVRPNTGSPELLDQPSSSVTIEESEQQGNSAANLDTDFASSSTSVFDENEDYKDRAILDEPVELDANFEYEELSEHRANHVGSSKVLEIKKLLFRPTSPEQMDPISQLEKISPNLRNAVIFGDVKEFRKALEQSTQEDEEKIFQILLQLKQSDDSPKAVTDDSISEWSKAEEMRVLIADDVQLISLLNKFCQNLKNSNLVESSSGEPANDNNSNSKDITDIDLQNVVDVDCKSAQDWQTQEHSVSSVLPSNNVSGSSSGDAAEFESSHVANEIIAETQEEVNEFVPLENSRNNVNTRNENVNAEPGRGKRFLFGLLDQRTVDGWVEWYWKDLAPETLIEIDERGAGAAGGGGDDNEREAGRAFGNRRLPPGIAGHFDAGNNHGAMIGLIRNDENNEGPDNRDGDEVIRGAAVLAAAAGRPANPEVDDANVDVDDDPDNMDDGEDLEGILELIGMQGPIVGLFQNALFSAILVSATVTGAVWLPYLWGKLVILVLGSPFSFSLIRAPLYVISSILDFLFDLFISATGLIVWGVLSGFRFVVPFYPFQSVDNFSRHAHTLFKTSFYRLIDIAGLITIDFEYLRLSMNSHAALYNIKDILAIFFTGSWKFTSRLFSTVFFNPSSLPHFWARSFRGGILVGKVILACLQSHLVEIGHDIYDYLTFFNESKSTSAFMVSDTLISNPLLAYWSATDRTISILIGYLSFAIIGAIYLKRGKPFSSHENGQQLERFIAQALRQAGGVVKVIVIISIEMIVFPLYCGLLLDVALLPLFEGASIMTRIQFTQDSPRTSLFIHWFIGTCYMFHFALFVSMCRKIMRKGVLYFIRDPDDPTFHPVRDVLERTIATQLRKIALSAIVYGALVIACLGGVVWLIACVSGSVFPLRWVSSKSPVEFPLDILFFNSISSFVIRKVRPSDSLKIMYTWWLKKSARTLRLTNFLFGERRPSEERTDSWFIWDGKKRTDKKSLAKGKFVGRYVRAPASDLVRIPKGEKIFLEVDKHNNRLDGNHANYGIHARFPTMFKKVYLPPWFKLRIAMFIIAVWLFAAATGVGATVFPLVFGRWIISLVFVDKFRNDIYAYSVGTYTFGAIIYIFTLRDTIVKKFRRRLRKLKRKREVHIWRKSYNMLKQLISFSLVYFSLGMLFPLAAAVILETYFLVPFHSYIEPQVKHVIHLVQDWTLGMLYMRIIIRFLIKRNSKPARAARAVFHHGWARPNLGLFVKYFFAPALIVFFILTILPGSLAILLNHTVFRDHDEAVSKMVLRLIFPISANFYLFIFIFILMRKELERWKGKIREEVYVVGQKLHNYGERSVLVNLEQTPSR